MAKKDIDVHIRAHDRMTRTFRNARRESAGLGRSIGKLAGIAAGFLGFRMIAQQTIGAVRESVVFQKQLAEISTMLDENVEPTMAGFRAEIMKMAVEFGQSKEVLTKGLYDILSAGIAAGDGITVLRVAARAAIGGVTDAAVAVDGLTTVMNAYGLSADEATRVSDLMFLTVKEGKITYEELAENIGKIAPVAKAANVPLEDMFAMLATAVKVEKPERAFTAIRAALMTASKEGKVFLDVVRDMRGATLEQILAGQKQKKEALGLFGVLEEGGKKTIVFAKRAAVGVSILTGNMDELEEQIIKARDATGKADVAFQKMADTNFQKISKLGQAWANVKTEIGDAVAESAAFQEGIEIIVMLIRRLRGKEEAVLPPPKPAGAPAGMMLAGGGLGLIPERAFEARQAGLPALMTRILAREPGAGITPQAGRSMEKEQTVLLKKIETNTQKTGKNTEVTIEGRRF